MSSPAADFSVVIEGVTINLPTLQAAILVVAAIYALANLLADLLYARFNPKIRFGRNVA